MFPSPKPPSHSQARASQTVILFLLKSIQGFLERSPAKGPKNRPAFRPFGGCHERHNHWAFSQRHDLVHAPRREGEAFKLILSPSPKANRPDAKPHRNRRTLLGTPREKPYAPWGGGIGPIPRKKISKKKRGFTAAHKAINIVSHQSRRRRVLTGNGSWPRMPQGSFRSQKRTENVEDGTPTFILETPNHHKSPGAPAKPTERTTQPPTKHAEAPREAPREAPKGCLGNGGRHWAFGMAFGDGKVRSLLASEKTSPSLKHRKTGAHSSQSAADRVATRTTPVQRRNLFPTQKGPKSRFERVRVRKKLFENHTKGQHPHSRKGASASQHPSRWEQGETRAYKSKPGAARLGPFQSPPNQTLTRLPPPFQRAPSPIPSADALAQARAAFPLPATGSSPVTQKRGPTQKEGRPEDAAEGTHPHLRGLGFQARNVERGFPPPAHTHHAHS